MEYNPFLTILPPYLLQKNPRLILAFLASVADTITITITTSTGVYTQTYTTVADRSVQAIIIPLAEVPIAIRVSTDTTTTFRGHIYCTLGLRLGTQSILPLAGTYLSYITPLSWPPSIFTTSANPPGLLTTAAGSNPAAGANSVYTVPTGARQRILSIQALLTTVGINTPTVQLVVVRGAQEVYRLTSPLVHPAATAETYFFVANSNQQDVAFDAANRIYRILPPLELMPADTLTFTGQDADDNWDAPIAYIEELIAD